jgi:hypothetical protein
VLKLNLEDDPELAMVLAQLRLNEGKSWKPKIQSLELPVLHQIKVFSLRFTAKFM